jgi:hypothetical protein
MEAALIELCVTYGYCLPPDKEAALVAQPPADLEAFVDAVLSADGAIAEGIDPRLADAGMRAQVAAVLRDWLFDDGQGKGTRSGLP